MQNEKCIQLVNKLEDLRAKLAEYDETIEKAQDAVTNRPREEETRRVLDKANHVGASAEELCSDLEKMSRLMEFIDIAKSTIKSSYKIADSALARDVALALYSIDHSIYEPVLKFLLGAGEKLTAAELAFEVGDIGKTKEIIGTFSRMKRIQNEAIEIALSVGNTELASQYIESHSKMTDRNVCSHVIKYLVKLGDFTQAKQKYDSLIENDDYTGLYLASKALAKKYPQEISKYIDWLEDNFYFRDAADIALEIDDINRAEKLIFESIRNNGNYCVNLVRIIANRDPAFAKKYIKDIIQIGLIDTAAKMALTLHDPVIMQDIFEKYVVVPDIHIGIDLLAIYYCEFGQEDHALELIEALDDSRGDLMLKRDFLVYYFNKLAKEMKE